MKRCDHGPAFRQIADSPCVLLQEFRFGKSAVIEESGPSYGLVVRVSIDRCQRA
jgi:hypothetical protein